MYQSHCRVSANEASRSEVNLTYTDVINFCTQGVVPILEFPSRQVAAMLEHHRAEGEQKKARLLRLKAGEHPRVPCSTCAD